MSGSAVAATVQPPVHETTLSNGLKVLMQEVHTAPVVSFMVWYKVGSRNESAGITGISHLLEHMMFKGTPTYGKGEIARILQRNGASFNAGTSIDYTNYFEVLASDRLDLAIQLEADRMRNALIPDEEHRLEMTVVRSELERSSRPALSPTPTTGPRSGGAPTSSRSPPTRSATTTTGITCRTTRRW